MQIRAYINGKFDILYSHSGCIKLLAHVGFEYNKPKVMPHIDDTGKQATFIAFYGNLLSNLPVDEAVYLLDAV